MRYSRPLLLLILAAVQMPLYNMAFLLTPLFHRHRPTTAQKTAFRMMPLTTYYRDGSICQTHTRSSASHQRRRGPMAAATTSNTALASAATTSSESVLEQLNLFDPGVAESLAAPLFGFSLLPYLVFLFFLSRKETGCPPGVTVGFITLLVFVFLSIPAAIAATTFYGVSLSDCDYLHGAAESMLTVTNLIIVLAFRQALTPALNQGVVPSVSQQQQHQQPASPFVGLAVGLTVVAVATALYPATSPDTTVHTPYLGGFLDLPFIRTETLGGHPEPDNALSIPCWIIHVSSLVEFLVAMGFAWRWADVVSNPRWKGLTWGLLPLHSSGITACTYHIFYNQLPWLLPLQALLTCLGNTTAAVAAFRIAQSGGWTMPAAVPILSDRMISATTAPYAPEDGTKSAVPPTREESKSLAGFEDLGEVLASDNNYSFVLKLFVGCATASYMIKYGETFFPFPFDEPTSASTLFLSLAFIMVPTTLNAYKWYRRTNDATFEGWF